MVLIYKMNYNSSILFHKKSQELSITIIIAAVIALVILVVIIAILTGKLGSFSKVTEESSTCGRACISLGMGFENKAKINCPEPKKFLGESFKDALSGCCCV